MKVRVIGGGLAGTEACYQLVKRGHQVELYEMRPAKNTPCHKTDGFAELVCSNSLKSAEYGTASGLLKDELKQLDCFLLRVAEKCRVPAGSALAVDREAFSAAAGEYIRNERNITVVNEEYKAIDTSIPTVIASGPLTSQALTDSVNALFGGKDNLHFYDAVAPIIAADSIDLDKAFFAVRYNKGDAGDYLNAGMNREEYEAFYNELIGAECVILKEFEKSDVFEGCMPIEIMAKRGSDTVRFGPLKPVGIVHPESGEKYYAVVQLRRENAAGTMYNMVGFQTNLTFPEQRRVFRMIPGLENAEFLRYGVMHRNTYLDSPKILNADFETKEYGELFFAGQMTGVEGYVESIMSGLIAAVNLSRRLDGKDTAVFPSTTLCGALQRHISTESSDFQPMNANFGILPPVCGIRDKKQRKKEYHNRAINDIIAYIAEGSV